MFASKSNKFVFITSLRDRDSVLIKEFLELALRPGIEKIVTQISLSARGRSTDR